MSDDPYRILGLKRGASLPAIKAAYRRQARANHPDVHQGKSPEEQNAHAQQFRRAAWAYELLTDPEARAYYDRTGVTLEEAKRVPMEIEQSLVDAFRRAIADSLTLRYDDLAKSMRLRITDQLESARGDAQAARGLIRKLREVEGRMLNRGDPDNVLASALAREIAGLEREIERANTAAAHHQACLNELAHWTYRTGGEPGYVPESRTLQEAGAHV